MKKKVILLLMALAFVFLMVGAYSMYHQLGEKVDPNSLMTQTAQTTQPSADASESQEVTQETEETRETIPAPDFTVYDREGNPVKLSDFRGKPVVLNFWASWCGPCKMEMPDFYEKYQTLGEKVQFLMVNMTDGSRETVDTAFNFISDQGYTFPVYYDTAYDAANTYGVYALPTTYFLSAEGNVVTWASGAISGELLQTGIDMILQ